MMKVLIIATCLIGISSACGILQRLKVKTQWSEAFGYTEDRETFNDMIWKGIFKAAPETVERYFVRVRGDNIFSPDFRAHAARVMAGFDMTLSLLDDTAALNAQLAHLKLQHIDLDVDAKYLELFRTGLMDAVQSRIGRCYDQDAWETCTTLIEDGIKH